MAGLWISDWSGLNGMAERLPVVTPFIPARKLLAMSGMRMVSKWCGCHLLSSRFGRRSAQLLHSCFLKRLPATYVQAVSMVLCSPRANTRTRL